MVSLAKLSKVTEEGVEFESPHDSSLMLLTPEKSMQIQNAIGADIMMQLDDVVPSTLEDADRMREAMHRSIRWLDRCVAAHARKKDQNLFPIVQGGLDPELRKISAQGWSLANDRLIQTMKSIFIIRANQTKHVRIRNRGSFRG